MIQYEASYRLDNLLESVIHTLRGMGEDEANASRGDGKWTRKELLGHLIDSAANNHHRFVRIGYHDGTKLAFPDYAADAWVTAGGYAAMEWQTLVALWYNYNRLLSHIIRNLNDAVLDREVLFDGPKDVYVKINDLVRHYCDHTEHHLQQIVA